MATTVALFGGSFNPPHVAHALVALYVLETAPVDQLWFVPTWKHAFGKDLAPFDDRVAMCELAAAPLGPRVSVSRVEEEVARARGGESRTLYQLETLAISHADCTFRLVVGADILHEVSKWYRWDEVCRLAPPIVIGRGGVEPPAPVSTRAAGTPLDVPAAAHVSELAMPAVSSTEVRRRIDAGEDASGLVTRAVLGYIDRRGLYR